MNPRTLRALLPALLLMLAPASARAETRQIEPRLVSGSVAHFSVADVEPRQIVAGRLVSGKRRRTLRAAQLRRRARSGVVRIRVAKRPVRHRLVLVLDTTPPTAPAPVSVRPSRRTVVTWARSRDDIGVRGYELFRGDRRVKLTSKMSFTGAGGGSRSYKVRAVDRAGNRSAFAMAPAAPIPSGQGPSWRCGWGTFDLNTLPGACWRPFADDSFLNTPLPPEPRLLPQSATMVQGMIDRGLVPQIPVNPEAGDDWFHPYFFSRPTDPEYRVVCNKKAHDCPIEDMRLRIPPQARPADSEDGHMTVIDQSTGWEWDFWNVQTVPLPPGGGDIVVGWGGRTRMDGPGGGTEETDSPATMAALGSVAGIIRFPEIVAGRIDHALFMTTKCSNGEKVFPAQDYGGECGDEAQRAIAPAAGQWLRLDMSDAEIGALPVSDWQKTILRAFARYGGFVGDTGGRESFGFQIESEATYTALGKENPWVGWVKGKLAAGDPNIDKWPDGHVMRYRLDVGEHHELWESRVQVVDPCVIQRTC